MNLRRLSGLAVGLALSLSFALPAAADFGDDIRDNIDIPTSDDFDMLFDTPSFSFPDNDDSGDGDDNLVGLLPGSFDDGDEAREDAQSLADDVRDSVGVGSDD